MSPTEPLPLDRARALAAAVAAVPGVEKLAQGTYGQIALLFPGERVPGLRLADADRLEVHVVVDLAALGLGADLHAFSRRLRAIAAAHTDLPVTVVLADAVVPTRSTP